MMPQRPTGGEPLSRETWILYTYLAEHPAMLDYWVAEVRIIADDVRDEHDHLCLDEVCQATSAMMASEFAAELPTDESPWAELLALCLERVSWEDLAAAIMGISVARWRADEAES